KSTTLHKSQPPTSSKCSTDCQTHLNRTSALAKHDTPRCNRFFAVTLTIRDLNPCKRQRLLKNFGLILFVAAVATYVTRLKKNQITAGALALGYFVVVWLQTPLIAACCD